MAPRRRKTKPLNRLGLLDGKFKIPDDFNRPLPASLLKEFEGRRAEQLPT